MANKILAERKLRKLDFGGLRPGALQLVVQRGVKAESLHVALDKILDEHGCPTCGLNGLDVNIRVQDPIFEDFSKISGVADISNGF